MQSWAALFTVYSFGEDANGELYALFANGQVLKLVRSLHSPVNAACKDFNHDGYADLVWENTSGGQHAIWLLKNGVVSSTINLPTVGAPWRVAGAGDFDGDGYADLLWENTATGQHVIWLLKNGVFSGSITLPTVPVVWSIVDH
jgi:hypothetical protein